MVSSDKFKCVFQERILVRDALFSPCLVLARQAPVTRSPTIARGRLDCGLALVSRHRVASREQSLGKQEHCRRVLIFPQCKRDFEKLPEKKCGTRPPRARERRFLLRARGLSVTGSRVICNGRGVCYGLECRLVRAQGQSCVQQSCRDVGATVAERVGIAEDRVILSHHARWIAKAGLTLNQKPWAGST